MGLGVPGLRVYIWRVPSLYYVYVNSIDYATSRMVEDASSYVPCTMLCDTSSSNGANDSL